MFPFALRGAGNAVTPEAARMRRGNAAPQRNPRGLPAFARVQLWPSKRLVTEPSLNTSVIARAIKGAMESTVSLSSRCS
jgi:hypothetical protein